MGKDPVPRDALYILAGFAAIAIAVPLFGLWVAVSALRIIAFPITLRLGLEEDPPPWRIQRQPARDEHEEGV